MKRVYLYPVAIEECEEGGFLAKCTPLQGCYAEGKTIKEAVENLKDVIKIVSEYRAKRIKKFSIPQLDAKDARGLKDLNVAVLC